MKPCIYLAGMLIFLMAGVARADLVFNDEINTPNEVNQFHFNVGSSGSVNLYTTSNSFNPFLTLWSSVGGGSDWQVVASNDNRSGANFFETINAQDAKIVQSLTPGMYLATVTESGNSPLGSLLSQGWSNQGTQTGDFPYELTIAGNVSAVPLPSAVWLFGSSLMAFLGFMKKRGSKSFI